MKLIKNNILMIGKIYHVNHRRGMYSVLLSEGGFIVFELLATCELSKDDIISGTITGGGDTILNNLTTEEKFDAYIQLIDCTEMIARNGCK
jgi:hypothetical protein